MPNLRYASASPDRLYDSIEDRYFITEKLAVEKMNEALERAAKIVESSLDEAPGPVTGVILHHGAARIRALKENA